MYKNVIMKTAKQLMESKLITDEQWEEYQRLKEEKENIKTYRLYIREYSLFANDYIVREEIVKTNDLYHEIGKIYCQSLVAIKRIDYEELKEKGGKY